MGLVARVINKPTQKRFVVSTARNPYGVWETAVYETGDDFLPLDVTKPVLALNTRKRGQAQKHHADAAKAFQEKGLSEIARDYQVVGSLPLGQLLISETDGEDLKE